jgi:hypothetical protein
MWEACATDRTFDDKIEISLEERKLSSTDEF